MSKQHHHGSAEGPSQRQLRVAEEIRHALSGIFAREEFRDPVLHDLRVTVTEVDLPRKRIALSMKAAPQIGAPKEARNAPAGPRPPGPGSRPGAGPRPAFNPAAGSWNALADAFDKAKPKD